MTQGRKIISIITWNVNGLRALMRKFHNWPQELIDSDILCFQETKLNASLNNIRESLKTKLLLEEDSYFNWQNALAQKQGYSGTGVGSRLHFDKIERLKAKEFDDEGRGLCCFFGNWVLINAYYPNAQEGARRLNYKLNFTDYMQALCLKFTQEGKAVIVCGDFNIAHKAIDLARPKENEHSPGYFLEERQAFNKFEQAGFIDAFRHFEKRGDFYTWWSYRSKARERNVGWRIDGFWVNELALCALKDCTILSHIEGSDHCPVRLRFCVK